MTVGSYGYQWDVGEDFDGSSVPHLKLRIEKRTYSDIDPTTKTYNVSSEQVTGEYNNSIIDSDLIIIMSIDVYEVHNTSNPITDAVNSSAILEELPMAR